EKRAVVLRKRWWQKNQTPRGTESGKHEYRLPPNYDQPLQQLPVLILALLLQDQCPLRPTPANSVLLLLNAALLVATVINRSLNNVDRKAFPFVLSTKKSTCWAPTFCVQFERT